MNPYDVASGYMAWWEAADDEAREAGFSWYGYARGFARALAKEAGVPLSVAAGVTAVLSPRVRWAQNKGAARTMLLDGQRPKGPIGTSIAKAERIIAGERPRDVVSGPKVSAFYRQIMGDNNATVIDTWMVQAAGLPAGYSLKPAEYEVLAEGLRIAAKCAKVPCGQFQAVVWTSIRGSSA